MKQRLDYKKTFLLGFGFLGVSVMWMLYNSYVPIFLQAGNPAFEGQKATTVGFGLSATLAGLIMTLDNIAALFIQPVVGLLSDRTRTRIGRRMPYILIGAPIAAVAFALIPIAVNQIPAELSGQTAQLGGQLAFFMIVIGLMLLAMAVFRTPVIALMPDITPSPLRSRANGVINMMGGIGCAAGDLWRGVPVQDEQDSAVLGRLDHPDRRRARRVPRHPGAEGVRHRHRQQGAVVGHLPPGAGHPPRGPQEPAAHPGCHLCLVRRLQRHRDLFHLLRHLQAGGVRKHGVAPARLLLADLHLLFHPRRHARRAMGAAADDPDRTGSTHGAAPVGLVLPNLYAIAAILFLGGIAWSLININSLPMVVDLAPGDRLLGTYTGLYYIAGTSAAIVGPILNGWIIDLTGKNYSMIFLVAPVFMILAMVCMWFVTRGEAKS